MTTILLTRSATVGHDTSQTAIPLNPRDSFSSTRSKKIRWLQSYSVANPRSPKALPSQKNRGGCTGGGGLPPPSAPPHLGAQVHHDRALATRRCSRHPDTPAASGGSRNQLGLVPGDGAPCLLGLEAAGTARGPSERSSRTWRESFHPIRALSTSDSPGHQMEACKTSLPWALCKISPRFGELARSDARHSSSSSDFLGDFLRPPWSAK